MEIIAVGTLKGGVGKSAVSYNLAGLLAENNKVLLIDSDPQTNLSLNVGVDVTAKNLQTIQNIFEGTAEIENIIFKRPIDSLSNLDIIPSSILLTATELRIVSIAGREQILKNFILDNQALFQKYDYILIDTNPSMGIINQNAFFVADSIILVSDVSLNSIQGAELFIALWDETRRQLRKKNNIEALILNNYDRRIKLSGELMEHCKTTEDIKEIVLNTVIPSSVKIKETELEHRPINILYRKSVIHEAFKNILAELNEKGII